MKLIIFVTSCLSLLACSNKKQLKEIFQFYPSSKKDMSTYDFHPTPNDPFPPAYFHKTIHDTIIDFYFPSEENKTQYVKVIKFDRSRFDSVDIKKLLCRLDSNYRQPNPYIIIKDLGGGAKKYKIIEERRFVTLQYITPNLESYLNNEQNITPRDSRPTDDMK